MLKVLSFQKLKYFLLAFQILFVLLLLFNSQFSSAQVCLPLEGYLVWSGPWEPGRIPMASSSQYVLTASPFYVSGGNVGLNTTNPVYTLDVNGTISANKLCIKNDCRSAWPSGGITGSGSPGQVAFWRGTNNLSGSNNLLWDNNNSTLRVNGTVIANNFSGNFLGRINASNVSAGTFGANTGGGDYYFPRNVGIGTTRPTSRLEIASGGNGLEFGAAAGEWLIRAGVNGNRRTGIGILNYNAVDSTGGTYYPFIQTRANNWGDRQYIFSKKGIYIKDLPVGTDDFTGNGVVPAIGIDSNGNVGIGTTKPGAKLEVAGQIKITGGNPGPGKVLTSDANGLASWQPLPPSSIRFYTIATGFQRGARGKVYCNNPDREMVISAQYVGWDVGAREDSPYGVVPLYETEDKTAFYEYPIGAEFIGTAGYWLTCADIGRNPKFVWRSLFKIDYQQNDPDWTWATEQTQWTILNTPVSFVRVSGSSNDGGYCYAYWGTGHVATYRHDGSWGLYNVNGKWYYDQCPTYPPYFNNSGTVKICQKATDAGEMPTKEIKVNLPAGTKIYAKARHTIGRRSDYIKCYVDVAVPAN